MDLRHWSPPTINDHVYSGDYEHYESTRVHWEDMHRGFALPGPVVKMPMKPVSQEERAVREKRFLEDKRHYIHSKLPQPSRLLDGRGGHYTISAHPRMIAEPPHDG